MILQFIHPTVDVHLGCFQFGTYKNKRCSGHLHNSFELETIQMPINNRMDNQIVVRAYDKILVSNKDQTTDICNIMDKSQKHYIN